MSSSDGACEIMAEDEVNFAHHFKGLKPINCKVRVDARFEKIYGHGDGCGRGQLAEAFDLGTTPRPKSPFCQAGVDLQPRNTLKKPIRVGSFPQPSGIGISESVTLKQALRKLCISQASEMAAMKRLSKPIGVSGISEAGNIKRLYASVVVQSNESVDKEKGSLFEISIVPQKIGPEFRGQTSGSAETCTEETPSKTNIPSHTSPRAAKKVMKLRVKDVIASPLTDFGTKSSVGVAKGKSKTQARDCIPQLGDQTTKLCSSPCPTRPAPKNKNFFKGNDSTPASGYSGVCSKGDTLRSNNTKQGCQKEASLAAAGHRKQNNPVTPKRNVCNATKYDSTVDSGNGDGILRGEVSEGARSKEKGESSQSSKSSMGDHSSSTSVSDESSQSTSSGRGRGCRPHMSKDFRWIAIRQTEMHQGSIGLDNFMLLKRLGCGDIGTVYLAELIGTECLFALKVMDNDFLLSRKKMSRAQTEREILQILDHPFLPTLYTYFTTDNLSCLVMEYCPGGDLHVLRQRQPGRSFSEPAARFYVAEVLLALEYLHMLGVVYRDLKPENILVREDGHIMLSDFDLSLRCAVSPTLLRSSSSLGLGDSGRRASGTCAESSSCVDPRCLHPSWVQVSCFGPSAAAAASSAGGKKKGELAGGPAALPQLVAEPTEARSNSFVGTHEYLAPEIIKGDGHGSSVDWWTLGIFLYELLFGRTPFKGAGNEETLANVVTQSLTFPASPAVGLQARDLIRGLLVKEPEDRLGSLRGAAEIKQHPFFQGLNWALIRCAAPPETRPPPAPVAPAPAAVSSRGKKEGGGCLEFRTHGERVEFELF